MESGALIGVSKILEGDSSEVAAIVNFTVCLLALIIDCSAFSC